MSNVHSCHAGCREPLCVLRREKDLRAERDALQSEVERLRDTLDHARFKCTMLAGRTTYSPEQFENGRYVCGELAEEIKRVLVRREAVKPELEPGEYKRALRDAHDKIDALQSKVERLTKERRTRLGRQAIYR